MSAPSAARAFSSPDAYAASSAVGGGGGRWFSGSPADGFGCSVCHSAAPGQRTFPLYVAGLPFEGYQLASRHEVVLTWPEFTQRWMELRANPMLDPAPGQPVPALGLVAELVAESGKASGTIEINTLAASRAELCEQTRPNLQPRLGVKLYQVRPGVDPVLLQADAMGILRCESHHLGQRCLIALSGCGAQQLRFTWVAPATPEGAMWFSAGMVASEALSDTFEQDSVQEISLPFVQAGTPSAAYQDTLHGACTWRRADRHRGSALHGISAAALTLFLWRARRRSRRRNGRVG
jgi:hypothetical protein